MLIFTMVKIKLYVNKGIIWNISGKSLHSKTYLILSNCVFFIWIQNYGQNYDSWYNKTGLTLYTVLRYNKTVPYMYQLNLGDNSTAHIGVKFDLSEFQEWKLFSERDEMKREKDEIMCPRFLALSYSAHSPDVCRNSVLAWGIKGLFLQRTERERERGAAEAARLWLSRSGTEERQKRKGDGVRPASIRRVQVKIPIWVTDADEWRWMVGGGGGGRWRVGDGGRWKEDEERRREGEQQGKSLSLPNLTRRLMYSRGNS